jgi:hypothetical protein
MDREDQHESGSDEPARMTYARQIAKAKQLIHKYGQSVNWQKSGATPSGPQPWKKTPAAPVDNAVEILFLRAQGGSINALFHLLKGTDIPEGGKRGLMGAVGFTPDIGDTVIQGSVPLTIKSIDTLAPNGPVILYFLEFC